MPRYTISNLISNDDVSFVPDKDMESDLARLGFSYSRAVDWGETVVHLHIEAPDQSYVRQLVMDNRRMIEKTLDLHVIPGLFKVEEEVQLALIDNRRGQFNWD